MWPLDTRKIMEMYAQPLDMVNSPFAFPRLPPKANPPLGISSAGKIKDSIVHDSDLMMSRLSDYQTMFQKYASGLFNLTPNRFMPGHPMHMKMQASNSMEDENQRLRKEISDLKSELRAKKK